MEKQKNNTEIKSVGEMAAEMANKQKRFKVFRKSDKHGKDFNFMVNWFKKFQYDHHAIMHTVVDINERLRKIEEALNTDESENDNK